MITNFTELLSICTDEVLASNYSRQHLKRIIDFWLELKNWMESNDFTEFSEDICDTFCKDTFGDDYLSFKKRSAKERVSIRAARMLISYQKEGRFEVKRVGRVASFESEDGNIIIEFLAISRDQLQLSESTVKNKTRVLSSFDKFLKEESLLIDDLSVNTIESFYQKMEYTIASKYNASGILKEFLTYAFKVGYTSADKSVFINTVNYRRGRTVPTTYSMEELKTIISMVDRSSPIGKRNYLIILLIITYGWRALDVSSFKLSDIDWESNTIKFTQTKTKVPVSFPLLSVVGNSIIDYIKNGRPNTDISEVMVTHSKADTIRPLSSATIYDVVSGYIKRLNPDNYKNKKCGPHSLRHSLASNLLKHNIPIMTISTVLGHQSVSSTSVYLKVDFDSLKQCAIKMPPLSSDYFNLGGSII